MIDVTIIVPVYNVKPYLKKCLDSLVQQDYDKNKIEIFVIDDFSTDGSDEIIKEYEQKYNFITTRYLEKNCGVSYARNIGIKECNGEYIMFCDSDDTYEKNAVSIFMKKVKEKNADFITANYYITSGNKDIKVDTSNYFSKDTITKKEIVSYMTLTSCSKIIKRSLFIDNNIYYPEDIKRCEELTVIPVVAYLSKNPIAIDDTLYHYYQRKKSASNSNKKLKKEDFNFFNVTFERFEKYIDKNKYGQELEFRFIDHIVYGKILVMLKANINSKEVKNEIDNIKEKYPDLLNNEYIKKYNKMKIIFIKLINYKIIFLARMFAKLHEIITG